MSAFRKSLYLLGLTSLVAGSLQAQVIFSTDLSGVKNWNFDSVADPNGQIGGTDQFVYTVAAGLPADNGTAFLTKNIDGASIFASQTGTLRLSFDLDLSNYTTGTSDFSKSNLFSISTSVGNKNSYDGLGSLYNIGVGGYNHSGEYSFGSSVAVTYYGGGVGQINWISTGSALLYHVDSDITVSGDDATGWTISYVTNVTGPGIIGTPSFNSTYTKVDANFNGLQSINGLDMGYKAARKAYVDGDMLVMDNVSLSLVPEPGTYAAIFGCVILGLTFITRRRKA